MLYPQYAAPQPQPYPQGQPPRTAVNELDAFLSGLAEDERANILGSPEFGPMLAEYLNRFLFFLLQGDSGAAYIAGSPARRETAEVLKLTAHRLHAEGKNTARSDVERLEKENRDLRERLLKLEGGKA